MDGRQFTAGDVIDHVKRLAGGLRVDGHVAQKPVALMAPNSPEYCIIFHAVAWAGGTITTLNPNYTAHEIRHQLHDSGAGLLITVPRNPRRRQRGAERAARGTALRHWRRRRLPEPVRAIRRGARAAVSGRFRPPQRCAALFLWNHRLA
jgi:acyl-CoA synthetase (AMP-forming)/AMP-acid ligase II